MSRTVRNERCQSCAVLCFAVCYMASLVVSRYLSGPAKSTLIENETLEGTNWYLKWVFDSGPASRYLKGIVEYIPHFAAVWFLCSIFKHDPHTIQSFLFSFFNTFHFPWSTKSISGFTWNITNSMPAMTLRWTILKYKNIKFMLHNYSIHELY